MSELAAQQMAVDLEILTALAQSDLALARRLSAAALAEPDNAKAERLARTYHRVARSVRQTIWLKQRILHGRVAPLAAPAPSAAAPSPAVEASAAPDPAAEPSPQVAAHAARALRTAELGEGVGRVILAYTEREREADETENLDDYALDERLEPLWDGLEAEMSRRMAIEDPDPALTLDAEVAEVCATLKLPADLAARWRTLPALADPGEMVAEAEAAEAARHPPPVASSA